MNPEATPVPTATEAPGAPRSAEGLRGVAVSDSRISFVDGVNGRLLYRGYNIADLAEHSTYEETAYLLLRGELPTKPQLKDFNAQLSAERRLPTNVVRVLKSLPAETNPMDALRSAVSYLGSTDPEANNPDPAARMRVIARLIARTATVTATWHRIRTGQSPVPPRRSGRHAENFYRMLTGADPEEFQARAMDVALILHADHEFNASTFAARVTASTLSDVYSGVVSALGTLKGTLHGGANRAVMRQLVEVGSTARVDAWVREHLEKHEKVMGFGHAVYKTMDPRAAILKKLSEEAGRRYNDPKWYELSAKIQESVYRQKQLWPNVDFYTASLYKVLQVPDDLFTNLFAVSRVAGWCAHILEQYETNKLIRPLSNYIGAPLRPHVAIGRRRS